YNGQADAPVKPMIGTYAHGGHGIGNSPNEFRITGHLGSMGTMDTAGDFQGYLISILQSRGRILGVIAAHRSSILLPLPYWIPRILGQSCIEAAVPHTDRVLICDYGYRGRRIGT